MRPLRFIFELIRKALGDLVDGEHFFDIVSNDSAYKVLYDLAGWPRVVRGRAVGQQVSLLLSICPTTNGNRRRRPVELSHRDVRQSLN